MEKRSFSDGSRSGGSKLIGGSRSFGRSGPTEESSSTESSGFTGKSGPIEVDFLLKNAGSLVTIKD